jgi:hypothetical protein
MDLTSADGEETAGNLKLCANDVDIESFRFAKGVPGTPGVLGAVVIPARRLEDSSGMLESVPRGEYEDISGEGCVDDRWFIGANTISKPLLIHQSKSHQK